MKIRSIAFGMLRAPLHAPFKTALRTVHQVEDVVLIVASDDAIRRLGVPAERAPRILASVTRSERVYEGAQNFDAELTRETTAQAYEEAGVGPADLDLIELHDAFAIEELLYVEAMGLCDEGEGAAMLMNGEIDVGGRCAVSPSGGLLAMGHPIGATGAMILGIVLDELERRDLSTALVTLCAGGGIGIATIIERV